MKYLLATLPLLFTGCVFSDSALQYAKEGTQRGEAGYNAKADMTYMITQHLATVNKDCGVKVEIINNTPVTTVKECVRFDDAMEVVNNTQIVQPQAVKDMADSAGDFIMKATNLAVPLAGVYYNYKTNQQASDNAYKTTVSNNELRSDTLSTYTTNFTKDTVQVVNPEVVTNETTQVVNPVVVNPQIVEPTVIATPKDSTEVVK